VCRTGRSSLVKTLAERDDKRGKPGSNPRIIKEESVLEQIKHAKNKRLENGDLEERICQASKKKEGEGEM